MATARLFQPLAALLLACLALAGNALAQSDDPVPMAPVDENVLVLDMGEKGVVEIELLPQHAPLHVTRIKELTRGGQYDGVAFHRVIDGFMAQTGDVKYGTVEAFSGGRAGFGGSDLSNLPAEFSTLHFGEGIVGMARAQDPDSANSQFFIMLADGEFLNGKYTVFGRVMSGMETVHAITKGTRDDNGMVPEPDFIADASIKSDIPPEPLPKLPQIGDAPAEEN